MAISMGILGALKILIGQPTPDPDGGSDRSPAFDGSLQTKFR
jgi:hypothetical protein